MHAEMTRDGQPTTENRKPDTEHHSSHVLSCRLGQPDRPENPGGGRARIAPAARGCSRPKHHNGTTDRQVFWLTARSGRGPPSRGGVAPGAGGGRGAGRV